MKNTSFPGIFTDFPLREKIVVHIRMPIQMVGLEIRENCIVRSVFFDIIGHKR